MVQQVHTRSKHSDLLCSLSSIKTWCSMNFWYKHICRHQASYLSWGAVTLLEQWNVACDTLASQAVIHEVADSNPLPGYHFILPQEGAAMVIDVKFNVINWSALWSALSTKPDMYGVWLEKQTIVICVTTHWNMACIGGEDNDRCLNCRCRPECHDHLCCCHDPGWTPWPRMDSAFWQGREQSSWLNDWPALHWFGGSFNLLLNQSLEPSIRLLARFQGYFHCRRRRHQ